MWSVSWVGPFKGVIIRWAGKRSYDSGTISPASSLTVPRISSYMIQDCVCKTCTAYWIWHTAIRHKHTVISNIQKARALLPGHCSPGRVRVYVRAECAMEKVFKQRIDVRLLQTTFAGGQCKDGRRRRGECLWQERPGRRPILAEYFMQSLHSWLLAVDSLQSSGNDFAG